jgi:ABC-type bacteriocin/lantibiotic exporter with double-glycine peptidase domain
MSERRDKAAHQPDGAGGIKRVLSYATRLDLLLLSVASITSLGAGAALPIMNIIFGKLTEDFTDYFTPGTTVTEADFRRSVDRNALYIFCLFVAKFGLGYIASYAFRMSGIRISAAIRLAYLSALLELPISAVDRLQTGSATDTLTNIANTIQMALSEKLGTMLQGFALIITAYVVAFNYSWRLTLVSSSVLIFTTIILGPNIAILQKHYAKFLEETTKASGVAGEVLQGIRTIKSLGAEEEVRKRHARFVSRAKNHGKMMSKWMAMQLWPIFFGSYANMSLTFWAGLRFYSQGLISGIGELVM